MDYFKIAEVLKPQGLKGELKLKPFTDHNDRFSSLPYIYLKKQGSYEKRALLSARFYRSFVYIKIEHCDTREAAEDLRKGGIYIEREHAAQLEEGSHYFKDLIGLELFDGDQTLGKVSAITNTGAADIYAVAATRPFSFAGAPGVILDVDFAAGRITVDKKRLGEVMVYD
jgi:16S rRNA processing protein RimM